MKLNLPNRLTLMRVIMIPAFVLFMVVPIVPDVWARVISAAIFILSSLTDFLDGFIARKFNLVTDFGKFLDPLADKMLVFSALLSILVLNRDNELFTRIFVWAAFIMIFREMAVTSMRLVAAGKSGIVIPAAFLGKLKTCSQMIGIIVIILEPVIISETSPLYGTLALSYICTAVMTALTVISGISYFKAYWPLLDPSK